MAGEAGFGSSIVLVPVDSLARAVGASFYFPIAASNVTVFENSEKNASVSEDMDAWRKRSARHLKAQPRDLAQYSSRSHFGSSQ